MFANVAMVVYYIQKVSGKSGWKVQSTPNNSNPQGKWKKVRVFGSLKLITGSKEISKWMGREKFMQLSNKVYRNGY